MSTGYGRDNVEWADARMTEIACHGRGAYHHFPRRITVIDIGAQDSKVILLDDGGSRVNFKMNRKCAAGTGAFLEEMALRLSIDISDLNGLAEKSARAVTLSSFCTVFAATEVLAKIREGEKIEDIVCAAFRSVVQRIVEMQRVEGSLVLTGGVVAHNPFMGHLLGEAFDMKPLVAPDAQFTGAFGAALLASEKTRKG
jgi:predicted CoA-substrate-specific enzyme activase